MKNEFINALELCYPKDDINKGSDFLPFLLEGIFNISSQIRSQLQLLFIILLLNLFSLNRYLDRVVFCDGKINNLMISISNFIILYNTKKFLYNFAVTGATSVSTALIFIDLSLTCCVNLWNLLVIHFRRCMILRDNE